MCANYERNLAESLKIISFLFVFLSGIRATLAKQQPAHGATWNGATKTVSLVGKCLPSVALMFSESRRLVIQELPESQI